MSVVCGRGQLGTKRMILTTRSSLLSYLAKRYSTASPRMSASRSGRSSTPLQPLPGAPPVIDLLPTMHFFHCGSACKKDPVSGVIGVQKGPLISMV